MNYLAFVYRIEGEFNQEIPDFELRKKLILSKGMDDMSRRIVQFNFQVREAIKVRYYSVGIYIQDLPQ